MKPASAMFWSASGLGPGADGNVCERLAKWRQKQEDDRTEGGEMDAYAWFSSFRGGLVQLPGWAERCDLELW